jgi:hypothetical protein
MVQYDILHLLIYKAGAMEYENLRQARVAVVLLIVGC